MVRGMSSHSHSPLVDMRPSKVDGEHVLLRAFCQNCGLEFHCRAELQSLSDDIDKCLERFGRPDCDTWKTQAVVQS